MTPPLDAAATKEWSLDARVADHPRLFDDRREPGPHSNVFLGVGTTLVPAPARHKRAGGFPQFRGPVPAAPSNVMPGGNFTVTSLPDAPSRYTLQTPGRTNV